MFDRHFAQKVAAGQHWGAGSIFEMRSIATTCSHWLTDYYLQRPNLCELADLDGENETIVPSLALDILDRMACELDSIATTRAEKDMTEALIEVVRDTTRYTFDFPLDIDMTLDQSKARRVQCERLFSCYPALAQYAYECFDIAKSPESRALALRICRHVARMPYVVWH